MEGDKVIQHPKNRAKDVEKPKDDEHQPENEAQSDDEHPNTSNTIPFPTVPEIPAEPEEDEPEDDLQNYGRGQRPRKSQGAYKRINEKGLVAGIAHLEDFDDDDQTSLQGDFDPPDDDFTLVATHPSDPKTLDEGLRGPDAKHWEKALLVKQ